MTLARILLASLALSPFGPAQASESRIADRVEVELVAGRDMAETAAHLASGYGRMVGRSGSGLIFELDAMREPGDVVRAWLARPSVARAVSLPPTWAGRSPLTGSVTRTEALIRAYERSYERHWRATGHVRVKDEEMPGLDYLEAYLQRLRIRAFPGDTIDPTGYREIAESRLKSMNNQRPTVNTWQFMGPRNLDIPYRIYYGQRPINGRVGALAFHPTTAGTYFMGGANGGVWKTTDSGVNWAPLTDAWPTLYVSSLAVDPTNPNVIYAGTGDHHGGTIYSLGVMKTTDGGTTWASYGSASFGNSAVSDIVIDPANPSTLIATGGGGSGSRVFRSTDSGQTWTAAINTVADWMNLSVSVPNAGIRTFWAVGSGSRVYKSSNNGSTWTQVSVPGIGTGTLDIACSKLDPSTVFVLDGGGSKVWKTIDNGTNWTNTTTNFPGGYNWSQSWYDWHLVTSSATIGGSPKDIVYVGLIDIVQSKDGGATWRSMGGAGYTSTYSGTAITHNDQHCAAVNPLNPNEVLVGNDGGVYRSTFNPTSDTVSWSILNRNLGITQFYTMAVHPTNPDYVLGGTQDNATPHSLGDLANWANPGAGDGAGCIIDHQVTNTQYDSYQGQNISRTDNSYASSYDITPSWSGHSVPFIGTLWNDPTDSRYVYANTNFLNRYNRATNSWSLKLGNLNFGGTVNAWAAPNGNINTMYVGVTNGQVQVSRNFGSNWARIDRQNLANGLPVRAITGISISPTNENDILVSVSGTGSGHLWRCADTSAATPQWTNVGAIGQVPNVPANCIERDPASPNLVWYLGTDVGVFKTSNAGTSWSDVTVPLGLPNVTVTVLKAVPATGFLNAATFGRGIWRLDLTETELRVEPSSFTLRFGQVQAGNVGSLATVDGNALRVCKFIVPNQIVAPVTVEVSGTSPSGTLASLKFGTTVRMVNSGSFSQTLDLFDHVANAFDPVDFRTDALSTTYQSLELIASGTLGRYLSASLELKGRYQIRKTGPASAVNWCVEHDEIVWTLTP